MSVKLRVRDESTHFFFLPKMPVAKNGPSASYLCPFSLQFLDHSPQIALRAADTAFVLVNETEM